MKLFRALLELFRYGCHHGLLAACRKAQLLHQQHVDDGARICARELDHGSVGAESLPDPLHKPVHIGLLPVRLVDNEHGGPAAIGGIAPGELGAYLDLLCGIHDEDGCVGHLHGRRHLPDEIRIPGRVYDVDLGATSKRVQQRAEDGHLPLPFARVVVAHRIALSHRSLTAHGAADKQHGLGKGGLAASLVSDEDDVANVFGIKGWHHVGV